MTSHAIRLLVLIVVSGALHAAAVAYFSDGEIEAREQPKRLVKFEVHRTPVEPDPPPQKPAPKPKPPEPEPPLEIPEVVELKPIPDPLPKKPTERRRKRRQRRRRRAQPSPPTTPAPNTTATTTEAKTNRPVFGASMSSTSTASSGPAVPVGNSLMLDPEDSADEEGDVAPLPPSDGGGVPDDEPVPIYTVSKMPKMSGKCRGAYTPEAREAGVEGSVTLDLVVNKNGRATDIKVVDGLGHGLDEAAVKALKRCRFTPGERGGEAVAVPVRGFKISFYLRD